MYPVALSVRGRRALVVGGGVVAERKVRGLLAAQAEVVVVSPALTPPLAALAEAGAIGWEPRGFAPGDLAGAFIAFAATDDDATNAAVSAGAHAAGVLVNDASDAARGDFATPAVHRAGPLTVTVDSGGLSPSFTRRIRDELALQFDARYARAARTLGALRERVRAVVPLEARAAVMQHFAERDVDELAAMLPGAVEHEVERAAETLAGVVPAQVAPLVCASRASTLALTQARTVMATLAQAGVPSTILEVTTRGDAVQDRSIAAIGTDNVFVKELEHALRERRADYAVHSCKDLPSTLAGDMALAAITARADARDAFCSERYATFDALPAGARVGTSSPRRRAQLRALRPDLVYDDVRGNVDTRLRKLREGQYDAIVLACAGLDRLGARATHTVPFPLDVLTPAVAQGALALETRADDPLAGRLAMLVGDPVTTLAVRAERTFLRTLRGGCQAPVGCHAIWAGGRLEIIGAIAAADGSEVVRGGRDAVVGIGEVAAAEALATALAEELLAVGGAALLGGGPLRGRVFLLPRTQDRPSRIAPALRDAGAEVVEAADSAAAAEALGGRVPTAILFPSSGSVGAVREYLAGLRGEGHRPVVAAMGPASSETAGAHGWPPDVVAPSAEVGAFVQTVTRFVLENGA
ncbi:MAG: hydroxymethylbilane synthase [Candidatus Eremiobacteraeota bacterium]|nr:hydroxymethylbilane synthase [Candidatus Eremiobacteraeota bacterium]